MLVFCIILLLYWLLNRFVGKLVGRYYDSEGNPTKYLKGVEAKAARGAQLMEKQKKEEAKVPGCNSKWSQNEGSEVLFIWLLWSNIVHSNFQIIWIRHRNNPKRFLIGICYELHCRYRKKIIFSEYEVCIIRKFKVVCLTLTVIACVLVCMAGVVWPWIPKAGSKTTRNSIDGKNE